MKARKSLALLLSVAMLFSMLSLSAFAADSGTKTPFPDAQGHWASSSIDRWAQYGIVKGDDKGNVNPNANLTRGELAQMFVNLFGLTEKAPNTYADLKGDEWYADAILKCTDAGIMQGDGASCNATANITRAETMVMFGRAMGVTPAEKPDMKFNDAADVPSWAAGYMAPLAEMGILTGSGNGSVLPLNSIDRASTMALLDKAITEYVNAPGEVKADDANGFVVVNVAAGDVTVSGTAAGVVVAAGSSDGKVVAKDLTADSVKVDGAAAVSLEGRTKVDAVIANSSGSVAVGVGVTVDSLTANSNGTVTNSGTIQTLTANSTGTVTNKGTIKTLTANDAVKVNNRGTIAKAEIKADNVILDGRKPTTVAVDQGNKNPTSSDGKEIKPGTTTNSGGSGYTYADVVAAPLHDTRADVHNAAVGTYVPDTQIANSYSVYGGAESITAGVTSATVTIDASHVMNHQNGAGVMGYWVGFGIPAKAGNTYYAGFGKPDLNHLGSEVTTIKDRTYVVNGRTYNTAYFSGTAEEFAQGGYVVVKNADNVTYVYNVVFNVTLAPNVENVKAWIVKDEASYNMLPKDYTKDWPWKAEYAIPATGPNTSACNLPWLAVTYDRNVATAGTISVMKDNAAVQVFLNNSSASSTATAATIGTGKYQTWHMTTQTGEWANKDYLAQNNAYGSYAVTVEIGGNSATGSVFYGEPGATYFTVNYHGLGSKIVNTIQVKEDSALTSIVVPDEVGYTSDGKWYKEAACTTEWTFNSESVTGNLDLYAKYTPKTYTVTYDVNGGTGSIAAGTATYDRAFTIADNAAQGDMAAPITRAGYTFIGWNTQADGSGTAYAAGSVISKWNMDADMTLYAQWKVIPATVTDLKSLKDALDGGVTTITLGADITLSENITIGDGRTVTVPEGRTLTIPAGKAVVLADTGALANAGAVVVNDGAALVTAAKGNTATGTVKMGGNIDLSKGNGATTVYHVANFTGTFDGGAHTLTVVPGNYANNSEFFGDVVNATFQNLTIDYKCKDGVAYSFVGTATGDTLKFDHVNTTGDLNLGTSNNSTAYVWLSKAVKTEFTNCDSHANITNSDNSSGNGTWNAVFLGGSNNSNSSISFVNCNNYGNLNMQYASVFYCNPLADSANGGPGTISFQFTNCHNYGKVTARKGGSIFVAISGQTLSGTSAYTNEYFNAEGGSFVIENPHSFTYSIGPDGAVTIADDNSAAVTSYVVTVSTPVKEYKIENSTAVEMFHGLGHDVVTSVAPANIANTGVNASQYKQDTTKMPAEIKAVLNVNYQTADSDYANLCPYGPDDDGRYTVVTGLTAVTIAAYDAHGVIGYGTLASK